MFRYRKRFDQRKLILLEILTGLELGILIHQKGVTEIIGIFICSFSLVFSEDGLILPSLRTFCYLYTEFEYLNWFFRYPKKSEK